MDINSFMESFKENLLNLFNDNLLFLGLQGSYGRGEAKESSDIDPVIILRQCGKDEILKYRSYIDTLPEKDILCGFVSSSDELRAWESADRAQLILDTKPLYGELTPLCPEILHGVIRADLLIRRGIPLNIINAVYNSPQPLMPPFEDIIKTVAEVRSLYFP